MGRHVEVDQCSKIMIIIRIVSHFI